MFCVKCGREGPTYESLCVKCFLGSTRFAKIRDHVDLFQCAHCDDFQIEGKWEEFGSVEEAARETALGAVELRKDAEIEDAEIEVVPKDSQNYLVRMRLTIGFQDIEAVEELETIVRLKRGICPRCSKIKGSYYESILQVRTRGRPFPAEEMERILGRIEKLVGGGSGSRDPFISKAEEVPGGLDVYLSSISLGKSISKELAEDFGGEVKESSSLAGQKDGKEMYRVTYLVRLPAYRVGDIVAQKERLYLVSGIGSQGTRLTDLATHDSMNISNVDLRSARVVGSREDILEAVVLQESEREIQVLDPKSYKTVEVRKPRSFKRSADTVRIFKHEGEIILLPTWYKG